MDTRKCECERRKRDKYKETQRDSEEWKKKQRKELECKDWEGLDYNIIIYK